MLVASGMWTTAAIRKLAEKHGVKPNAIYKDRLKVLAQLRAALVPDNLRETKTELILRARALYRKCILEKHTGTAARLLDFEARVLGANEPLEVRHTFELAHAPDLEVARSILNPESIRWARQVLTEAGEPIPNVLEVTYVEASSEDIPVAIPVEPESPAAAG